MQKKRMKTSKKIVIILALIFLIFVVGVPTVCACTLYDKPAFEITCQTRGEDDYVVGELKNNSIYKITTLKYKVSIYAFPSGQKLMTQEYKDDISLTFGQTHKFDKPLILPISYNGEYEVILESAEYEYTGLYPWTWYLIGFLMFMLSTMFFSKKKFYFDIQNHKVEIYATLKKAVLIIDGKKFKELKIKTRFQTAKCAFKVSGKVLSVNLKMGNIFPNVEVKVDGEIPEFTEIKQHVFLKAEDKQKEKPITQA
ncbi:MAG: hypothetical protein J6K97_01280 [Clostridia bacterium]|nr:hypothetical protein [Clostridia bacterium]